jgi:two-component sensor histidine kinase
MLVHLDQSAAGGERFDGVAEANHRIANHLSMIISLLRLHAKRLKAQTEPVSGAELSLLLGGIGEKVETIARLHRELAHVQGDDCVDLGEYLRNITLGVVSSLAPDWTDLRFALDGDCTVAGTQALPIGLIVCEVVTNAVKYAHPSGVPGRLAVACGRSAGHLEIDVVDDGVGLPDGFDPATGGQIGLNSIRALAGQLGATMTFASDALGVAFQLRVPFAETGMVDRSRDMSAPPTVPVA